MSIIMLIILIYFLISGILVSFMFIKMTPKYNIWYNVRVGVTNIIVGFCMGWLIMVFWLWDVIYKYYEEKD